MENLNYRAAIRTRTSTYQYLTGTSNLRCSERLSRKRGWRHLRARPKPPSHGCRDFLCDTNFLQTSSPSCRIKVARMNTTGRRQQRVFCTQVLCKPHHKNDASGKTRIKEQAMSPLKRCMLPSEIFPVRSYPGRPLGGPYISQAPSHKHYKHAAKCCARPLGINQNKVVYQKALFLLII